MAPDGGLASDAAAPGANSDGGPTYPGIALDGSSGARPPVVTFVPGVSVGTLAGSAQAGEQDGTGTAAVFENPTAIKRDASGNLVVVDYDGRSIRLVTPAGCVTTIANSALLFFPFAAAVMDDGSYVISSDNDPGGDGGNRTPVAGSIWTVPPPVTGVVGAPVPVAEDMSRPRGIAPIPGGALFTVEKYGNSVGSLDLGSGTYTVWAGGARGFRDGAGGQAAFNSPTGATRLPDGSFAVADSVNGSIRRVTSDGTVTTIAGDGFPGMIDGPCAGARFNFPNDVAADSAGNLYVADGVNERIRRIRVTGGVCIVETLAGNGTYGYADGDGASASFYGEEGIDVSADGTVIYVADGNLGTGAAFHRIRTLSVPALSPLTTDDGGGASSEDAGIAFGSNDDGG